MNKFNIHCVALLFFAFIITVINAAPALDTVWHQHKGVIQSGLYKYTDHVVILNATNLKNTIYGTKNAWLIEFYANWCPHCQRFTTIWNTLSHSIDNWKDIVNVGVFDCATVSNTQFCQQYEVSTVPSIKYFSPYSEPDSLGDHVSKSEIVETLREKVINLLINDQENGNGVSWPNLSKLQDLELHDVFAELSKYIKYYFIIFEEPNSYLGSISILDLHNVPQITIRRVSSENNQLCNKFKVNKFPTLIAVNRENIITNLTLSTASRTDVYNKIKNFLNLKGIEINTEDIIDDSVLLKNYSPKRNSNRTVVKLMDDNIYQIDLESALQYSLKQEISLAKNISGEKMEALKNYLNVLVEYFPLKSDKPQYLNNIYDTIENKSSIDGNEFHNLIISLSNSSDSNEIQWIGCKGSLPHLRGYTCGLWTMFHTLSVRYAIAVDEKYSESNIGGKVILVMYNYAKHFFGCSHCAEHFVHMAGKRNINEVKTADQAVIWLWKAHNEVNSRLSGDVTEDPEHPKLQYPAVEHCPTCKNANNTWNELEVLNYLKGKYGGSRIKYNLSA